VGRFERGEALRADSVEMIQRALEKAGVIFVDANDGGPGVRLGSGGVARLSEPCRWRPSRIHRRRNPVRRRDEGSAPAKESAKAGDEASELRCRVYELRMRLDELTDQHG
jgi:hypothetical protein